MRGEAVAKVAREVRRRDLSGAIFLSFFSFVGVVVVLVVVSRYSVRQNTRFN